MSRSYDDFSESRHQRSLSILTRVVPVTVLVKRGAIDGSGTSRKEKETELDFQYCGLLEIISI
jgi:hypothetical protein